MWIDRQPPTAPLSIHSTPLSVVEFTANFSAARSDGLVGMAAVSTPDPSESAPVAGAPPSPVPTGDDTAAAFAALYGPTGPDSIAIHTLGDFDGNRSWVFGGQESW